MNRSKKFSPSPHKAVRPVASATGPLLPVGFALPPVDWEPELVIATYTVVLLMGLWWAWDRRERQFIVKLNQVVTETQQRTAKLEETNATKTEFIAGLSHEFLNPLNGIIGLCSSLKSSRQDALSSRKLDQLHLSASHLSSLLEDLIDLSRRDSCGLGLERKAFDLPELIDAVVAISAAESAHYGIPVEAAISPGTPRNLWGDPRRVRQVLLNLVGNALKYAGHGQVSVTVWCRPTNQPLCSEVVFAVSDEGPGIPAREQGLLFHRFVRGGASRVAQTPGSGLGLTLSKELAERMGGRIWLESESARGSCFYFSAVFHHAPPSVDSRMNISGNPFAGKWSRALIIDDQEYNRIVLRDLLESLGFSVAEASTASAALTMAGQEYFTHVLLDYELPTARGPDIARAIRSLPSLTAHSRIIVTTAHHPRDIWQSCHEAGMNACLRKPVSLAQLTVALTGSDQTFASFPQHPVEDSLALIRRVAEMKHLNLREELNLFLSELNSEIAQLNQAAEDQKAAEFARCAHMLCGRLGFVQEHSLARQLEILGENARRGNWSEIRLRLSDLEPEIARMQRKIVMTAATALPG